MVSPSGEYAESRPFKIFISLLDKWEIGAPLTEVLVYDALIAVKNLTEHPVDTGEDVSFRPGTSLYIQRTFIYAKIDFYDGQHTL